MSEKVGVSCVEGQVLRYFGDSRGKGTSWEPEELASGPVHREQEGAQPLKTVPSFIKQQ